MYLSDKQSVAESYAAERAPAPNTRRVYAVDIETGNLKVLDLTKDPRWQKAMQPLAPGLPSNETLIKRANENYGRFFKSFIETNKIDLKQYDAVIGPEHVRGGRQMCILAKSGGASPLQIRIRASFRVLMQPGAMPTRMPPGALSLKGKIGVGLKGLGVSLIGLGLGLLINWLKGKYKEYRIEQELKKLTPTIDADLSSRIGEVAELRSNGKNAFANVTVTLLEGQIIGMPSLGGVLGQVDTAPGLRYDGMTIGETKREGKGQVEVETGPGSVTTLTPYYLSINAGERLTKEEVDLYTAYRLEIRWYEQAILGAVPQDVLRLNTERQELQEKFNAAFR